MNDLVITTHEGRRFHTGTSCPGWVQGRKISENTGRTLHPIVELTGAQALKTGKLPCTWCKP